MQMHYNNLETNNLTGTKLIQWASHLCPQNVLADIWELLGSSLWVFLYDLHAEIKKIWTFPSIPDGIYEDIVQGWGKIKVKS